MSLAPVARPETCEEQSVRTESDLQGPHHADAPGCHRCGLPLLASTDFCPYCERSIHEGAISRIAHWRPAQMRDIRRPMITETRLLAAGFVVFALIAAASLVAALATRTHPEGTLRAAHHRRWNRIVRSRR